MLIGGSRASQLGSKPGLRREINIEKDAPLDKGHRSVKKADFIF
jgi:hypothetical protein